MIPTRSATFDTVLDSLKHNKILQDEMSFRRSSWKYPDHVRPGRYKIRPDAGNYEVIKASGSG